MKILLFSKKKICIYFIFVFLVLSSSIFIKHYCIEEQNNNINMELDNKVKSLCYGNEKIAYLTFDDGPTSTITPKILDILKSQDIKATFFVIGKSVDTYPEIVKRAYEEGHYIANHGYNHNNSILYKSKKSFIQEIKKTDESIGKAIGIPNYCSHIFRFPNGFMAPAYKTQKNNMVSVLSQIGYTYIDWNCLNNDSMKKYNRNQLIENLKKSSKDKNTLVILMHDTKDVSNSSEALDESIEFLKSKGYKFENFYNLIN